LTWLHHQPICCSAIALNRVNVFENYGIVKSDVTLPPVK